MSVTSTTREGIHWVFPTAVRAAKRVWAPSELTPWTKAHIVNRVSARRGYSHYLELCTPTSGYRYAEIDRSLFATCIRLMYNCPDSFLPPDGLPVDYRTTGPDISECMEKVRED